MWTIAEVKEHGRNRFTSNYWYCVLAPFIVNAVLLASLTGASISGRLFLTLFSLLPFGFVSIMIYILTSLLIAALPGILLAAPLSLGAVKFFQENAEKGAADLKILGAGFQNYWHNVGGLFLRTLYLLLWYLLVLIPNAMITIYCVITEYYPMDWSVGARILFSLLQFPFMIPAAIKAYSYRMVPYILLDRPELSANDVITRSRKMMDGNKLNTFLLDLSFIGWFLLGVITVVGFPFWTAPYKQSTDASLYLRLRGAGSAAGYQGGSAAGYQGSPAVGYQGSGVYALRAVNGPLRGGIYQLGPGGISLGRAPGNTVCLPSDTKGVSSRHCRIIQQGASVMVSDLGSSFGTYLNGGEKLTPNRWYPIQRGSVISLGSQNIQFQLDLYY